MSEIFSPQTAQDWYNQIQKDLKGKTLEDILVKNYENIPIKAFFVKEDINEAFSEQVNNLLKNKTQTTFSEEVEIISDLLCPSIEFGKKLQEEDLKNFFDELHTKDRFVINLTFLHNAGANAIQELALALALANFYLEKASDRGNIETMLPKMSFSVAVGANFFMEIAKLRVLPYLINRLVNLYLPEKQDYLPFIKAQTAQINKSEQDAYNNIIRATLEAMAANIAQVDEIQILPHDYFSDSPDSFSENIAKNIQHILHYESKIDFVKDISSGAYFIEYLSYQLAQKAWELFQQIQSEGGIVSFAEKGSL
ncbi:MAG: methylmalonyl-CoA mutase family protein, partial [Raineya sp.]